MNNRIVVNPLLYILLIAAVAMVAIFSDYSGRMKTYNYHMCVEVYGLNEECK